jgi:dTDP-4-amino-4,6-dideoxy-D-galactose acyltransferase
MSPIDEHYFNSRSNKLFYYSPYSFVAKIDKEIQLSQLVIPLLKKVSIDHTTIEIIIAGKTHYFIIEKLSWDSSFFGGNMYRLHTVLYDHEDLDLLTLAIQEFKTIFFSSEKRHCYVKIPSEDLLLIQALTKNSFYLAETRLNFYKPLEDYNYDRFEVRNCGEQDAEFIREVAAKNRNIYDRFHADPYFNQETADRFLGEYAYQCVKGYSDIVLMPSEKNIKPEAFIAISDIEKDALIVGEKINRIALTAVGAACRGWHLKLCSEALYYAKNRSAKWMFMTTQSTNTAVFISCSKLGFCLGSTEHVFSFKN